MFLVLLSTYLTFLPDSTGPGRLNLLCRLASAMMEYHCRPLALDQVTAPTLAVRATPLLQASLFPCLPCPCVASMIATAPGTALGTKQVSMSSMPPMSGLCPPRGNPSVGVVRRMTSRVPMVGVPWRPCRRHLYHLCPCPSAAWAWGSPLPCAQSRRS